MFPATVIHKNDSRPDDDLRQAQIAFQGKIVASATHEFQNHLAVIKEYSGLAGDLLGARKADKKQTLKRGSEIVGNIGDRAVRAAELADTLNRFVHRGDALMSSFRVHEVIEDLVALLQRTASQQGISLKATSSGDKSAINNKPSLLQYLVFSLVSPLMDALGENGDVTIFTVAAGDSATVRVVAEGQGFSAAPERELMPPGLLAGCLHELAATLSSESTAPGRREIVLTLPSLSRA